MADGIVPAEWMQQLAVDMAERMNDGIKFQMILSGKDPDNLETRYVEHPLSPEFLAARKAFVKEWKKIQAKGLRLGFLDYDHCYECGGVVIPTTETTEYLPEPNPDYDPDKPLPALAQHVNDGKPVRFSYEPYKFPKHEDSP